MPLPIIIRYGIINHNNPYLKTPKSFSNKVNNYTKFNDSMSNNNIPPQQQPSFHPRTLSDYQQLLNQLKLQTAKTNGSVSQILSDVNSDWHNNVVRMIEPLLMEKEALERQLAAKMQELEKVYNAHPEIKIALEKPKKVKV